MTCVPAPACKALLAEASTRWPSRNKASDGICASPKHSQQNPASDHETGDAVDLTHDPARGVNCDAIALALTADPRTKYLIRNRRIWSRVRAGEGWRPYRGINPHTKHLHVSIRHEVRDDTRPWFPGPMPAPPQDDVDVVESGGLLLWH